MENFLHLFDETGLRSRTPCRPLPFVRKLTENFLRLGQIVFGPRFVVRFLTVKETLI